MTKRRRITMKDVAEAVDFSTSTVSLALRGDARISEPVRQKVCEAAERLGYRVNLNGALLSQTRPKIIGVVANFEQELHSAYIKEMADIAPDSGFKLIVENASLYPNPLGALEKLTQFRADTIIAIDPPECFSTSAVSPAVVIAQGTDLRGTNLVTSDSRQAAKDLADHLRHLGHFHVVYLDGPSGVSGHARRNVLKAAMNVSGIELKVWPAGNTLEAGFEATQRLLAEMWNDSPNWSGCFAQRRGILGETTAVVCYNDQCAQGAYIALMKAGVRVPMDVSLVGFDNSKVGASRVFNLTSIDRNPTKIAWLAFEIACQYQQENLPNPVRETIPSTLVVRETTGTANYLNLV